MSHRGGGQRQGGGAEAGPSTVLGPADQDGADGFTLVPQKDDLPAVSDTTFKEFYESLDEFLPTIPDGLTEHALQRCGFEQPDHRIVRLVSLAAEKFVEDVGKDVKELIVLRGEKAQEKRQAGKTKQVLTTEDLTQALSAAHPPVRVAKPPYHT